MHTHAQYHNDGAADAATKGTDVQGNVLTCPLRAARTCRRTTAKPAIKHDRPPPLHATTPTHTDTHKHNYEHIGFRMSPKLNTWLLLKGVRGGMKGGREMHGNIYCNWDR
jgi:hypothetical protein